LHKKILLNPSAAQYGMHLSINCSLCVRESVIVRMMIFSPPFSDARILSVALTMMSLSVWSYGVVISIKNSAMRPSLLQ